MGLPLTSIKLMVLRRVTTSKVIQNRVARFLGSSTLIVARALLTEPDSQYNLSRPDQSSG